MITDRLEGRARDGRRVVMWRSRDPAAHRSAPVVVIGPGMNRRMRHSGAIAQHLAGSGAVVYRYDALDHVGLSDGDIVRFTLSAALESLRVAVDTAASEESADRLTLLPLSISAIPACLLAAEDHRVERVVGMSGVVDGRATFARCLGEDYFSWREEDLPPRVRFEGHEMDPHPMWREERRTGWFSVERMCETMAAIRVLVVNVVGLGDEWVTAEEVRRVFEAGGAGPRMVVQLPHVSHTISRNLVALRAVLGELTRLALGLPEGAAVAEPTFEELLDLHAQERRRDHDERLGTAAC